MMQAVTDVLPDTLFALAVTFGLCFAAVPLWRGGRYAWRRMSRPLDRLDRWAENLGRRRVT